MKLPWKRKRKDDEVNATTPLGQIRQLYTYYQKQSNRWGYLLLSSMALICFWVLFSIMAGVPDYTYLALPLAGIGISIWQMRKIKNISGILKNAHEVQRQIEKAEGEKKAKEEEEAAKAGQNGKCPKVQAPPTPDPVDGVEDVQPEDDDE